MASPITFNCHPRMIPTMTASAYCRQIAGFLHDNPGSWTQGVYARDSDGFNCDPEGDRAKRLCLAGLLIRFVKDGFARNKIQDVLPSIINSHSIPAWNDDPHRTVADVERVLLRAAQRCEALYADEPQGEAAVEPTDEQLEHAVPFAKIMEQLDCNVALAA